MNTTLDLQRGHDIYAMPQKVAGKIVDFSPIDNNVFALLVITQETEHLFLDLENKIALEFPSCQKN